MKGLKATDNVIIFIANDIQFGIWDEPDVEKWAMFDEDGNVKVYAIDQNFEVVEFDESIIPEDYSYGKYLFVNGEFVPNPDWQPDPPSIEERVNTLEEDVAIVAESANDSEEALCDLDETLEARLADIEEALCELSELLQ